MALTSRIRVNSQRIRKAKSSEWKREAAGSSREQRSLTLEVVPDVPDVTKDHKLDRPTQTMRENGKTRTGRREGRESISAVHAREKEELKWGGVEYKRYQDCLVDGCEGNGKSVRVGRPFPA